MSEIAFTVYGTPAPAGSKRGFYNARTQKVILTDDSKRSRPWKAQVSDAAGQLMSGRELLRGALELRVVFVMPRPKGHFGKGGVRASAPKFPTTRPDVTKLLRAVEDAMLKIVYDDDSQIVAQAAYKEYGEPGRVEITVGELVDGPELV